MFKYEMNHEWVISLIFLKAQLLFSFTFSLGVVESVLAFVGVILVIIIEKTIVYISFIFQSTMTSLLNY